MLCGERNWPDAAVPESSPILVPLISVMLWKLCQPQRDRRAASALARRLSEASVHFQAVLDRLGELGPIVFDSMPVELKDKITNQFSESGLPFFRYCDGSC